MLSRKRSPLKGTLLVCFCLFAFAVQTVQAYPLSPTDTEAAVATITGTITSDDGEPLIGATVVVQGTTTGAVTDIDGNSHLTSFCFFLLLFGLQFLHRSISSANKTSTSSKPAIESQVKNEPQVKNESQQI